MKNIKPGPTIVKCHYCHSWVNPEIGGAIRALREEAGFSVSGFVRLIKTDQGHWSGIEHGNRGIGKVLLGRFCDALGITLGQLFTFQEERAQVLTAPIKPPLNHREFTERTDRLAALIGVQLGDLPAEIGISRASFFGYRSGKTRISAKAWLKLTGAEKRQLKS